METNTHKHTSMGESFYVIYVICWNRENRVSLRVSVSSHLIHVSLAPVCLEVIVFQLIAASQNTHKCTQEGLTFDWHEPQSRAKPGNTMNKCDKCYFQLLKKPRTTESYESLPLNMNDSEQGLKKRNESNLLHD